MQFAGFEAFGGATLSRVVDGAGAVWRGCCMQRTGHKETFGFYITRDGIEVPYAPFCKGRGQVTDDGWWTAWQGSEYFEGPLPGFAPKGGYTIAPNGSVRVFVDQDGYNDRKVISLAAFGIPVCSALNVRLSLDANAGIIFRCGPEVSNPNLQAAAMLTCTGLGVENRAYESGVISTTPARTLLIATENGAVAKAFVDVLGWWG